MNTGAKTELRTRESSFNFVRESITDADYGAHVFDELYWSVYTRTRGLVAPKVHDITTIKEPS